MKYNELIQFDPIDEIIKFGQLDHKDYREKLVKNFVFSTTFEENIIPRICADLDLTANKETKGIQIVGNYGTGKSHLMSLFSIIAEDASYLDMVQSEKAKDWLKTIAGKYKVYRFELGHSQELWDVITYKIDMALEEWGVDYSISNDNSPHSYSEKLELMLSAFEEKYPDKGFMLVVDEMLAYLKGRSEPSKLNRDLQVLQALGQTSDRTHFRMVFGVQELIYRSPEFQFAKDMLGHVNERFVDFTIEKEDVQFIVQQRLLQKNDHQKAWIRKHLSKFIDMFPHMKNNIDTYVNLFPVHPTYFDNFSLIRIGKSQREVLKTLSRKFGIILNDEVPTDNPGLICYDSYWQDMLKNVDLHADPDVNKVSNITELIDQKIEENFTKGRAPKKALAHRIVAAAAIKILQADLSHPNGVTAETLANDLCHVDNTCENFDELVDLAFGNVLNSIVTATIGQYFEKGENNEYHIRIEGGVNYDQKVKDYAAQMGNSQKDEYFYMFLAEIMPVEGETYRRNFKIWSHNIEWQSHNCTRPGYIFMGNPNNRSTTQPQQHFYIYFMPIFDSDNCSRLPEKDSVYFLMNDLSEELKSKIVLYGSALCQEGSASSDEKPRYKQLRDKYYQEAKALFNEEFLSTTLVEYLGEKHPIESMPGAQEESKIDIVSAITSYLMEKQFEAENPHYPKFSSLQQPMTPNNRDNLIRSAKSKIAKPNAINGNAEAVLMGLGLWENGRLSTEHSEYARSIKQKLESKGGQVLNRDEILEVFFDETHEYISSDYHIEADLEMLVLATMAALGEIEIVLQGGTRLNAGNITEINRLASQDNYTFSNVCQPKGINIPLLREISLGLLGTDRTNELDTPNSSIFADLISSASSLEKTIASLQRKIQRGYYLASDIEVISEDKAREYDLKFVQLKGICTQLQRYNTKAKMRNIEWPLEMVKTAMTKTRKLVFDILNLIEEIDTFSNIVSYLRTALTNISDLELKNEISLALSGLQEGVCGIDSARDKYKRLLNTLKDKYADWYLEEYLKAHISEIENGRKQMLLSNPKKTLCDIIRTAAFVNPSRYDNWVRKIGILKVVDPNVNKQTILAMPTSSDGFNPTTAHEVLPKFSELQDELNEIFAEYEDNFHDALEDPTINKNKELLNEEEKIILKQFKNGEISLDVQYVRILIDIISKLQKSFTKIEVTHDEILRIFSKPMTKQQAIQALTDYIDNQSRGHRPEDIRIIVK